VQINGAVVVLNLEQEPDGELQRLHQGGGMEEAGARGAGGACEGGDKGGGLARRVDPVFIRQAADPAMGRPAFLPRQQARDMLVEHVDPEFGPYIGPGMVPKFSETPGEVRWSGTWQEGSHNEEIYCGLLGLTATELDGLRQDGVV